MVHQLRMGAVADAPVLAALHAACFAKPWDATAFATFLADPGALCVIARDCGGLAPAMGFVLARLAANEAEILTIAVAPAHRRLGVAEALMRTAQEALAARGGRRLFLEVGAGNQAARALYAGLGFAEAGRRQGYYQGEHGANAEDALLLAREL